MRSVELGVCPMQLFHFEHVTFIQFKMCWNCSSNKIASHLCVLSNNNESELSYSGLRPEWHRINNEILK